MSSRYYKKPESYKQEEKEMKVKNKKENVVFCEKQGYRLTSCPFMEMGVSHSFQDA